MITLSAFAGRWTLTRHIDDRRSGVPATLHGLAEFVPDAAGLTLTETGRLRPGAGPAFDARRSYLWRAGAGAGQIDVAFDDGRPFHSFSAAAPAALHECPPDTYRVTYDFDPWPLWSATWHVTGPRKDYTMVSTYAPTSSVITREDRSSVR